MAPIHQIAEAMKGRGPRRRRWPGTEVEVKWIAGHEGVEGNERADEEAKKAAKDKKGSSPREDLPAILREGLKDSVSALKAAHKKGVKARWGKEWAGSRRAHRLKALRLKAGTNFFIKLTAELPKRQISILSQLYTRHIPLNAHLRRIGKHEDAICEHCDDFAEETIHHYLFDCPAWAVAPQPLMRFINETGRFKNTYGDICRKIYSKA